jgi:hypothetical protein
VALGVIGDGAVRWIVPVEDHAMLRHTTIDLLERPGLRQVTGEAGRAKAGQWFTGRAPPTA